MSFNESKDALTAWEEKQMMNEKDYVICCPVVNRFDLLDAAVASTAPYEMIVIDNSDGKLRDRYKDTEHVTVYVPPVPLPFSVTHNLEFRLAQKSGAKYLVHMHSDAQFPSSKITDLLDKARQADFDGRKWLIIFSLYEILATYNVQSAIDLGGYDAHLFPFYFADNSLFRRAKLLGYELIEGGGEGVLHNGGGSVTIHSDSKWQTCNDHTFPLYAELYRRMWGGSPGQETFNYPFDRPDVFPDLKPVIP
jgi:hypothetical protein